MGLFGGSSGSGGGDTGGGSDMGFPSKLRSGGDELDLSFDPSTSSSLGASDFEAKIQEESQKAQLMSQARAILEDSISTTINIHILRNESVSSCFRTR